MGTPTLTPQIPEWLWGEVSEYDIPLKTAPATVLDIGAHIGAYSLHAAQLWPKAVIYAYEPFSGAADAYHANCGNSKFHLTRAAVRAESGECDFWETKNSVGNTCDTRLNRLGEKVRVPCVAADSLPSAEFIKMDVEGIEAEILPKLDLSKTIGMTVEYHHESEAVKLIQMVVDRGFDLFSWVRGSTRTGILKFVRHGESDCTMLKKKVFIGLPMYWQADPFFFQSTLKLVQDSAVGRTLIECAVRPLVGDSAIGRARNGLTRAFLASDCTHLLFIDTDLVYSSEQIERIMEHEEEVVAGLYCKKQDGPDPQFVINGIESPEVKDNGLVQVRYAGTGFMRIARSVFEKMIEKWGDEMWYVRDESNGIIEYDFWHMGVYQYPNGHRRYLSEDWWFCQKCSDLGIKVWVDNHILLKHSAHAMYPLRHQAEKLFAEPASKPEANAVAPDSPRKCDGVNLVEA